MSAGMSVCSRRARRQSMSRLRDPDLSVTRDLVTMNEIDGELVTMAHWSTTILVANHDIVRRWYRC